MTALSERPARIPAAVFAGAVVLCLVVLWAYWTTLGAVVSRWAEDPQYGHGWLVPVFAVYFLWLRRNKVSGEDMYVNPLGLALIAGALAMRLAGTHYHYDYLDQISLLPCLAGIFMLVGSWPMLFWSLPGLAFLIFMIPLPHNVSLSMSAPMQAFATAASTFVLQVLGRPAIAEGNVILLNDIELGIVEACSGLRMLVVFFALSTAVSMLIRKPLWEKILIASSAIPIALASNVLRITVTGLFYDTFGNNFGGGFFHDLAGWLMMPLGLMFLGLELWILKKLLLEPDQSASADPLNLQRVDLNPTTLYRTGSSRREKAVPAPTVPSQPEPELEPASVATEEPVAQL